jgi:hypothetical protein
MSSLRAFRCEICGSVTTNPHHLGSSRDRHTNYTGPASLETALWP